MCTLKKYLTSWIFVVEGDWQKFVATKISQFTLLHVSMYLCLPIVVLRFLPITSTSFLQKQQRALLLEKLLAIGWCRNYLLLATSRRSTFLISSRNFVEKGTMEDNLGKKRAFGVCGFKTLYPFCNEVSWKRPVFHPWLWHMETTPEAVRSSLQ